MNIELTRSGVTPAKFLSYIRGMCKVKGSDFYLTLDEFANPIDTREVDYYIKDGKKFWHDFFNPWRKLSEDVSEPTGWDAVAEKLKSNPYDHQTYIRHANGSVWNEIIEFTFDDEKTGHGYFYQSGVMTEAM